MWLFFLFYYFSHIVTAQTCGVEHPTLSSLHISSNNILIDAGVVRLDKGELRSWGRDSRLPCPGMFRAIYRRAEKRVTYLAVNHLKGRVDFGHPTLAMIRRQIAETSPQAIMAEIGPPGRYPKGAATTISDSCLASGEWICGESAYTAYIGGQQDASLWGGETGFEEIAQSASGIEKSDLAPFESTRLLIGLKRSGVPPEAWRQEFDRKMNQSILPELVEGWSFDSYRNWLQLNQQMTPGQVESGWIEPLQEGELRLQQISYSFDQLREPLVLEQVQNTINDGDSSLLVYGSSHFYKQALALETALGNPKIECLE